MLKAPALSKQIKEQQLLWFSASNSYVIVDKNINRLINLFVSHPEKPSFISSASEAIGISHSQSELFYNQIDELFSTNSIDTNNTSESISFDTSLRTFSETYSINNVLIKINYSHKKVREILHPQIAHLTTKKPGGTDETIFDVFYLNKRLYFYKNSTLIDSYETKNYHVLQGNFCMQLLCVIHGKTDKDWLGTIHASTVTNGKEAILVIGKSS